jgi:hypothetical protein
MPCSPKGDKLDQLSKGEHSNIEHHWEMMGTFSLADPNDKTRQADANPDWAVELVPWMRDIVRITGLHRSTVHH